MVDKLCGNKHYASADMRQCIAKLSNRYTFFDARLQERSDILRLSMTFYKHLEQVSCLVNNHVPYHPTSNSITIQLLVNLSANVSHVHFVTLRKSLIIFPGILEK